MMLCTAVWSAATSCPYFCRLKENTNLKAITLSPKHSQFLIPLVKKSDPFRYLNKTTRPTASKLTEIWHPYRYDKISQCHFQAVWAESVSSSSLLNWAVFEPLLPQFVLIHVHLQTSIRLSKRQFYRWNRIESYQEDPSVSPSPGCAIFKVLKKTEGLDVFEKAVVQ